MAGIAGAGAVLVKPAAEAAAVASSSMSPIFVGVVFLMLAHQLMKGESEWPIDVDVMEDEE